MKIKPVFEKFTQNSEKTKRMDNRFANEEQYGSCSRFLTADLATHRIFICAKIPTQKRRDAVFGGVLCAQLYRMEDQRRAWREYREG